jgi:peptidoglycan-associated lipoprotein
MKLPKVLISSSILSFSILATGCLSTKEKNSKKSEPSSPAVVEPQPTAVETPPSAPSQESLPKEVPVVLKTIYFDFNQYEIREDQKENALHMAESLKANPNVNIQIQGHTDDRGSAEYNMALGQKRAQTLKNYFIANGVTNKIETISYGKERPITLGEDETAWSQNRRDEVVKTK